MASWWTSLLSNVPRLTPTAAIDILCVAFVIYQFISIVRGRRAAHILSGLALMLGIYVLALWLHVEPLRGIWAALAAYAAFALIVMVHSDIRRLRARVPRPPGCGSALLQRR